jgi:hypothetical protein
MTSTKLRTDVQRLGSRLGLQALAFTTIAASTLLGYTLHAALEQTRLDRVLADGVSSTALALNAFFTMDGTIAMILVPGLIVAGLALGGMYVHGRRS